MEMIDLIGGPMNHKQILRIMRKYGIVTKIRSQNAYRKIVKATYEHKTVPNHLNRRSISSTWEGIRRRSLIYVLDLVKLFISLV